jgi:hypothetical protein
MTSPFDPLPLANLREPLAGDIIGARWAVESGIDNVPVLRDLEPCIVCGTPGATCTHLQGALMPPARRAQKRTATPARTTAPRGQERPVSAGAAPASPSPAVGTGGIVTDTRDEGTFTVDRPGQAPSADPQNGTTGVIAQNPPAVAGNDDPTPPSLRGAQGELVPLPEEPVHGPAIDVPFGSPSTDDRIVTTEVTVTDRPAGAPASNADNPVGAVDPVRNRANEQGVPEGFILDAGSRATKLPVRRVENRDDIVEAREDIYVRRIASGTVGTPIYTLLMVAGTQFPKGQLDSVVM